MPYQAAHGRLGRLGAVEADHSVDHDSNQYQSILLTRLDRMIVAKLTGHTQSRCNGPQRCKWSPPSTVSVVRRVATSVVRAATT